MRRTQKYKKITVTLYDPPALPLLDFCKNELQAYSLYSHRVRGSRLDAPLNKKGVPLEGEMEILELIVDAKKSEEYFQRIYEFLNLSEEEKAMMTMGELGITVPVVLEIPETKKEDASPS